MQIKSGVATSEFWLTLLASGVSLLVISGVIPTQDGADILSLSKDIVSGVVAGVAIFSYIKSRTKVKEELLNVERLMFLVGDRKPIVKEPAGPIAEDMG